jgi:hypothetical protein
MNVRSNMKHSPKSRKTGAKNRRKNSKGTRKKPVSTSKVSTPYGRIDIKIPKTSKTYQFLYVDTDSNSPPKWKRLDAILDIVEANRTKWTLQVLDDFIRDMASLYPEKKADLDYLRPLILRQILKGEALDEVYYNSLKKIGL